MDTDILFIIRKTLMQKHCTVFTLKSLICVFQGVLLQHAETTKPVYLSNNAFNLQYMTYIVFFVLHIKRRTLCTDTVDLDLVCVCVCLFLFLISAYFLL